MSINFRAALSLVLLLATAASAPAAIVTSGMTLVETGGTFAAGNLAAGSTPFAPNIEGQDPGGVPSQPTGYGGVHTTTGVVNLTYGNSGAWLAGSAGSYIGLNLGGSITFNNIAYGRDNLGAFPDRSGGLVTLEYTTDATPSLLTSSWTPVGNASYDGGAGDSLRHRFAFGSVTATGIRLVTDTAGRGIDEIELYNLAPPPPVTIVSNPGFTIGWNGNDGDFINAAVPVALNLALAPGAVAIGSSAYPAPAHTVAHINDGIYGNSNSWLADPGDTAPFVGVDLGGSKSITSIAFSRSNSNDSRDPCGGGACMDRALGTYTLQYTTDGVVGAGSNWLTVGTITYNFNEDGVPGGGFTEWLRHQFSVSQGGSPLLATGLRILPANNGNAIDELEIYTVPEPSTLLIGFTALVGLAIGCIRRRA